MRRSIMNICLFGISQNSIVSQNVSDYVLEGLSALAKFLGVY